jgi:uncharacterized membrane protein YbhN (UPF0104 family)
VSRRLRAFAWLRILASVLLLAGLIAWIRPASLFGMLDTVSMPWLLLALAIGVPQLLLSAWRWRLTAGLLGIDLPFRHALREYCLGNFLNQVLPGGVAGDVSRAWRHARHTPAAREAWHAVLIERTAGQGVLLACALLSLPFAPGILGTLGAAIRAGPAELLPVLGAAALVVTLIARRAAPALRRFGRDLARAVLARAALLRQLAVSLALVCSYVAAYLCCARALGVDTPVSTLLPLICWVLLAMALPLSVAGWGIREGAAAGLWLLAGLPVAQGVAISLLYGAVVLLAALPGAWVLWRDVQRAAARGADISGRGR